MSEPQKNLTPKNPASPAKWGLKEDEVREYLAQEEILYARVFTPQDKSAVAKSPHFQDIMDRILQGWNPRRVSKWLSETHGEEGYINHETIRQYVLAHIPPQLIIPHNYLRRKFQQMGSAIDAIHDLEMLILVQENRLSISVQTEEQIKTLLPNTVKEILVLGELLGKLQKMKQSAGLTVQVPLQIHGKIEHEIKDSRVRKLVAGMDTASKEKVFRALSLVPSDEEGSTSEAILAEVSEDARA